MWFHMQDTENDETCSKDLSPKTISIHIAASPQWAINLVFSTDIFLQYLVTVLYK